MKKDRKITEYLDRYASEKPDRAVLNAARAELKRGRVRRRRWPIVVTAVAAAFVFVAGMSVIAGRLIGGGGKDAATGRYFAVSDVKGRAIDREEANEYAGGVFGETVEERYALFTFRQGGENAFVRATLRVARGGVIDDVTVYVMLTDRVYAPLERFESLSDGEARTEYENGEYYSDLLRVGDYKYCIRVMSPVAGLDPYLPAGG